MITGTRTGRDIEYWERQGLDQVCVACWEENLIEVILSFSGNRYDLERRPRSRSMVGR